MAKRELLRDYIAGDLYPDLVRQRQSAGWRLVAVEWERDTTEPFRGERVEVPYGMRVARDCHHLEENPEESEILRIIELYKGRILDVGPETVIVEHSGTEQEIDSLVALLGGFGIKEMVRTGTIALGRGSGAIDVEAILRAGPVPALPSTQRVDVRHD